MKKVPEIKNIFSINYATLLTKVKDRTIEELEDINAELADSNMNAEVENKIEKSLSIVFDIQREFEGKKDNLVVSDTTLENLIVSRCR